METPLISIILPTYNGAQYIKEAINSVLLQDFTQFELIIINDASTDLTVSIIEEYQKKDSRIRVLHNQKNLRLVATLNRGIQESKGKYIARIDDDDIWIDCKKLTKQLSILDANPHIGVVGALGEIIDENSLKTGKKIINFIQSESVRNGFCIRNQLIHTSILARKDVFDIVGSYDSKWLYVEDLDLWLRVLASGFEICNIPDLSVLYRIRIGSTTGKKYHMMQWLTFVRYFHERKIYPNFGKKIYSLCIRFILIWFPAGFIRFFK